MFIIIVPTYSMIKIKCSCHTIEGAKTQFLQIVLKQDQKIVKRKLKLKMLPTYFLNQENYVF